MARPSNTQARRAQIVDGFIEVMAEQGYDGASMSAVAARAGLTQGLIHYHFKNKEQVLEAAVDALASQHRARLDARLGEVAGDALDQISGFIDFHLGVGADADPRALACWVAIGAEAVRRPSVRDRYRGALIELRGRLVDLIEDGARGELLTAGDPVAAAVALLAAIQGYFDLAAMVPGHIPKGSAAPAVRAMADGLLSPRRAFAGDPR